MNRHTLQWHPAFQAALQIELIDDSEYKNPSDYSVTHSGNYLQKNWKSKGKGDSKEAKQTVLSTCSPI